MSLVQSEQPFFGKAPERHFAPSTWGFKKRFKETQHNACHPAIAILQYPNNLVVREFEL